MREIPMLFSSPMVRAIQNGTKTQTRRVAPMDKHGCPFGIKGDRIWVKETFLNNALDGYPPVYLYRADGDDKPSDKHWKPSIFMPRTASRITLEIVSVNFDRLHDITARDIISEGAVNRPHHCEHLGKCPVSQFDGKVYPDLKSLWASGWDQTNKKQHSWSTNPWVWVISFVKI